MCCDDVSAQRLELRPNFFWRADGAKIAINHYGRAILRLAHHREFTNIVDTSMRENRTARLC